jgi:uncharacterized membrane protein YeaQ/YmgE (transglycosylase-associated protein family)
MSITGIASPNPFRIHFFRPGQAVRDTVVSSPLKNGLARHRDVVPNFAGSERAKKIVTVRNRRIRAGSRFRTRRPAPTSVNARKRRAAMGILSWIVMGLIVGLLAKFIMPGRDPGGLVITILLGIAGAFVGGLIGSFLGLGTVTGFNMGSLLLAVGGALLLLLLYRQTRR